MDSALFPVATVDCRIRPNPNWLGYGYGSDRFVQDDGCQKGRWLTKH